MLAIVVPVIVLTLGFAWWFRAGNTRARYLPELGIFRPDRAGRLVDPGAGRHVPRRHRLDRLARSRSARADRLAAAKPIEIQVVSLDWKWLFIYPDQGVASVNQLVVPAGDAAQLPHHLGDGDEQLLRAAARQPDLRHGRAWRRSSICRPTSPAPIPGSQRAIQRRRLLRHALRGRGAAGRRLRRQWVADDQAGRRHARPGGATRRLAPAAARVDKPRTYRHGGAATCSTRPIQQAVKLNARQAHLGRHPVRPADPAGGRRSWWSSSSWRCSRSSPCEGLVALSVARVDHQRRPQADRRHVRAARAGHAAARLHRRAS